MPTPLSPTAIVTRRLHNQRLLGPTRDPGEVVAWLGAVQAQDYSGAKWALGLRTTAATDTVVEQAFIEGRILRTHVLRPTWHFVPPADIRWMLTLSAPRVQAASGSVYRLCELDPRTFSRSHAAIERALRGGRFLTRTELSVALARAGITADGVRLAYIVMCAELEGIICSGPRRGKQFTYALLDERVTPSPTLTRDEALFELTRRYFLSRGPATVRDYVWWSGLTVREARAGIDMVGSALTSEVVKGRTYWFAPSRVPRDGPSRTFLLPNYDEFGIAYRDREVLPSLPPKRRMRPADIFAHLLVIDGELVGRWKRQVLTNRVIIEAQPFRRLTGREIAALRTAAEKYAAFLQVEAALTVTSL